MQKNLLKLLRNNRNQSDIGKEYGVTQQGWQSWESGRTLPEHSIMLRMERNFDIPLEVIFFDAFNFKK